MPGRAGSSGGEFAAVTAEGKKPTTLSAALDAAADRYGVSVQYWALPGGGFATRGKRPDPPVGAPNAEFVRVLREVAAELRK